MSHIRPSTTDSHQQVEEHPVVLFDGVCNLCNRAVQFIVNRDPSARFRFAALQSESARQLLASSQAPYLPDSIVLVEGGRVSVQSTAVLRIARRLSGPWPLAYGLIILPRALRDWLYAWIARNRYRWFGKQDACMMPTPALRARFIDASEGG